MTIWGAIWGGIFTLLWSDASELRFLLGIGLGALAGYTLRVVLRAELAALQAKPSTSTAVTAYPQIAPRPQTTNSVAVGEFQPESTPAAPTAHRDILTKRPTPPAAAPAQPDFATAMIGKARDWLLDGNTVVRMGVVVLFIGLAFLAKYAMDNSLLPPELRLAAIGATAIALFVTGFRLRLRSADKMTFALTLQGAGVAVLYLTIFAAFRLYHFLPAGAAFLALGLICAFSAVIALAQNSLTMAFIGFAGGFAAPILVSTGQGSHVGLFSYYLVLGIAIAALAWARAWRPLNLLGFFATFGIASIWGVLKYQPEQLASTEPFLIAFFLVYVTASLLYATRHSLTAKKAVDATLIFGVPVVAFGLQAGLVHEIEYATAFSSLALGAFYLTLGWWMARRKGGSDETNHWLAESFAALGLGFVTLAVPLALDTNWTSAVWAVEGAGVYWMGQRQGRWLARAAGLTLQLLAAIALLNSTSYSHSAPWPLANPIFIGAVMLASASLAISWWLRMPADAPKSDLERSFIELENSLAPLLFWAGFLWWQFALHNEIVRAPIDSQGLATPVFSAVVQIYLRLVVWVGSAFAFHHFALPGRRSPWAIAATPAYTVLPVLMLAAIHGVATLNHVFESGGWLAWPILLILHGTMMRRLDSGSPQSLWPWVHTGGVWLLVLLVGNLLMFAIDQANLWRTAWSSAILLVASTLVILLLSRRTWFNNTRHGWPLDRFARAYLWTAAAPLVVAVAVGSLLVAIYSNGNARPLPYLPLLNPTDLTVAMALAASALWLVRLRGSNLNPPAIAHDTRWFLALAAIGFIAINTMWLRVAHHFGGVPWDAKRLFASFLVQAGYSILWTLLALGLMVGSFRRHSRGIWVVGAGLLGAAVLKMFVIDLSNRDGSERIFVFIAVGILMLVVGYFAPLPPSTQSPDNESHKELRS